MGTQPVPGQQPPRSRCELPQKHSPRERREPAGASRLPVEATEHKPCHPPALPPAAALPRARDRERPAAGRGRSRVSTWRRQRPRHVTSFPPLPPPLISAVPAARGRYRSACGSCRHWSDRRRQPGARPSPPSSRPAAAPHSHTRQRAEPRNGHGAARNAGYPFSPFGRGWRASGQPRVRDGRGHTLPIQSRGAARPRLKPRLVRAVEQRRHTAGGAGGLPGGSRSSGGSGACALAPVPVGARLGAGGVLVAHGLPLARSYSVVLGVCTL